VVPFSSAVRRAEIHLVRASSFPLLCVFPGVGESHVGAPEFVIRTEL
jgi:hypothetical protein